MNNEKQYEPLETKGMVLEHVLYEMEMYLSTLIFLNQLNDEIDKTKTAYLNLTNQKNMCIESHQIHLRNLLEFFNGDISPDVENDESLEKCNKKKKQRKNTNIVYSSIVNNADTLRVENMRVNGGRTVKTIINKSISHLTEERITENLKSAAKGSMDLMIGIIPQTIDNFINYLETNRKNMYEAKSSKLKNKINLKEEYESETIQELCKNIKIILDNYMFESSSDK